MLSLLLVPVRASESCVPVILSAYTFGRGDSTDNTPSSNTDVIASVVDNTVTIIIVVLIIVNIKASFDIYHLNILISYTTVYIYPSLTINSS
jgi:hypothetical protein